MSRGHNGQGNRAVRWNELDSPSEIEWIQAHQPKCTWHLYFSMAEDERHPAMLRAASMSSCLWNYDAVAVVRQIHEDDMVKGSSVLFTRHAPWGMWTDVPGSHATRGTGYVSLCAKIPALWHQARMRFQDCEELMADLVLQDTVNQPARATKLGTKTWKGERSLPVHLHAWVLLHGGNFPLQSLKPIKFRATPATHLTVHHSEPKGSQSF